MIHRDIKPANIIIYDHLGATDQIKLLDFGIARVMDADPQSNALTAEQSVVGTPSFMAPEQVTGGETKPASDLYSVGLVAYELLTGRRAADADSTIATMALHISDEPIFLPASVKVPGCLRAIVDTLLQKSLTDRYESAQQVLHDLEHWDAERVPRSSSSRPLLRYSPTAVRPSVAEQEEVKGQVRLIGILLSGIVICSVLAALLYKVAEDMDMMPSSSTPEPVEEQIAEATKEESRTEEPIKKVDEPTAIIVPAEIKKPLEPKEVEKIEVEKIEVVRKKKAVKKKEPVKPKAEVAATKPEEKPASEPVEKVAPPVEEKPVPKPEPTKETVKVEPKPVEPAPVKKVAEPKQEPKRKRRRKRKKLRYR